MKKFKSLLLAIFCLTTLIIQAQETPKDSAKNPMYLVVKTDGNELYGKILSDDGREILLETKTIGKVFINKSEIKYMKVVDDIGEDEIQMYGEFRASGPFTTRYAFTNNAFPIKKDESYALLHLYGPEIHFALNDKFSVGIMASWIASPIAVAFKYSEEINEKTYFSLGTIMGSSGYLNNARGYGGLHWATITHGTRMNNVSFSAGYGYIDLGLNDLFFTNTLGEKYQYQSHTSWEPYYIDGGYQAENAINEYIYGNTYPNYEDRYFFNNSLNGAFAFGLSGIKAMGTKASFIFDSMTFLRFKNTVEYDDYDVTVSYSQYDYTTGQDIWMTETYTIGKGRLTKEATPSATIVFMPGVRFTNSYDKAFQVALTGIINISSLGEVTTRPFPMVSWLRRF